MSDDSKIRLLNALSPLSNDIPWMQDLIIYLKNIEFPNSNFEIFGLARLICYEMNKENPDIYSSPNTSDLKQLIYAVALDIKIKRSNEAFSKKVEKIVNEEKTKSVHKRSSQSR